MTSCRAADRPTVSRLQTQMGNRQAEQQATHLLGYCCQLHVAPDAGRGSTSLLVHTQRGCGSVDAPPARRLLTLESRRRTKSAPLVAPRPLPVRHRRQSTYPIARRRGTAWEGFVCGIPRPGESHGLASCVSPLPPTRAHWRLCLIRRRPVVADTTTPLFVHGRTTDVVRVSVLPLLLPLPLPLPAGAACRPHANARSLQMSHTHGHHSPCAARLISGEPHVDSQATEKTAFCGKYLWNSAGTRKHSPQLERWSDPWMAIRTPSLASGRCK